MVKLDELISMEQIQDLVKLLPHSELRVPYTYHHDYLRMSVAKYRGMSRADVAAAHASTQFQLYAVACAYIIEHEAGVRNIIKLPPDMLQLSSMILDMVDNWIKLDEL